MTEKVTYEIEYESHSTAQAAHVDETHIDTTGTGTAGEQPSPTQQEPVTEVPTEALSGIPPELVDEPASTATAMPPVPDLLARIANRIATNESKSVSPEDEALDGMRQRLEALRQQAAASESADSQPTAESPMVANEAVASETVTDDAATHKGGAQGKALGTFASVEAALSKLSQQVDDHERLSTVEAANGVVAGSPEEPWNDTAAEQLTSMCEDAGLATGRSKDDKLIGNDGIDAAESPVSYVYLQPDAKELGQQWFEKRFDEISKRLDAVAGSKPADDASGLTLLLEKLDALEGRIEAVLEQAPADAGAAQGGNLHDIELCIAEIASQLEATTVELTRIESLEGQIGEIAKTIAAQRDASASAVNASEMFDMAALADLVASKVAANPQAASAGSAGTAHGNAAGIGELSGMMKDFVRERRSEGEHANAVLDTMQQTIIRVLDRMEALEAGAARAGGPMPHAPAAAAPVAAPVPAKQPVAPADARERQPDHAPAKAPAPAATAEPARDAGPIDRLQRVVGQLSGSEPAVELPSEPEPAAAEPPADPARSRADFLKAARQAAAKANQAVSSEAPVAVESDRAKFAAAARQAAANANKRMMNDDTDAAEIDATNDGFSLNSIGARLQPTADKPAKNGNRARLLLAAVALVAIGLTASKFMMSTSGDAARELQSNQVKQGSNVAGDKAAPASKTAMASPVQKMSDAQTASDPQSMTQQAAADPLEQSVKPGTVAYGADNGVGNGNLVQPVAVAPLTGSANDGQSASGGPGSNSRKALPSALVGPLSLRLAAANGDPSAEFQVAARFADGKGVKQNFDEAIKWYRRSAGRGFALAQYRLGTFYERGLGVSKDVQRARVWYERSASHDNVKAMHNLAVLAAGSSTGKPDYVTAARWFTQAADRGLGDSQFNLAILYQNGLGVPQDDAMAYQWFSLAAKTGDDEAARRMAELAGNLSKDKIEQIEGNIRKWRRIPSAKLANDPHFAGQAWQRKNS